MPIPPSLSKSLEKADARGRRSSASNAVDPPGSPSKTVSSRRSTVTKTRAAARRTSGNSENIRAMVRAKNNERRSAVNELRGSVNGGRSSSPHKPLSPHRPSRSGHSMLSSRSSNHSVGRSSTHSTGKAKKTSRPGAVSQFLKNTHRQLKAEIAQIQDHIIFLQELAPMKESKKVDLLFEMIDRDEGGTVDAEELAIAMRQNDELSFSASVEKAIDMVATFDKDGDGELDRTEFRRYVVAMVKELDMTAGEFSEYLIVQLLLAKETPKTEEQKLAGELAKKHIKEEVKRREELFAVLSNKGMEKVFKAFDSDSTGEVAFKRVAHGLYERTQDMDETVQEAMEVLLMMEKNDKRMLDYEQFGRLIMAVSRTAELTLEDLAESLMEAAQRRNARDDNYGSALVVEQEGSVLGDGDGIDSLTYGRLKKLFKLWDSDGSGDISVEELADGLGAFQKASGIHVDADAMAEALILFDEDGDGELDPREFSHAIVEYASQFGVEVPSLIDAMVLLSSKKIDEEKAEHFQDDFQGVFGASTAFLTCPDDLWNEGGDEFATDAGAFWPS